jgi:hypothetical protein
MRIGVLSLLLPPRARGAPPNSVTPARGAKEPGPAPRRGRRVFWGRCDWESKSCGGRWRSVGQKGLGCVSAAPAGRSPSQEKGVGGVWMRTTPPPKHLGFKVCGSACGCWVAVAGAQDGTHQNWQWCGAGHAVGEGQPDGGARMKRAGSRAACAPATGGQPLKTAAHGARLVGALSTHRPRSGKPVGFHRAQKRRTPLGNGACRAVRHGSRQSQMWPAAPFGGPKGLGRRHETARRRCQCAGIKTSRGRAAPGPARRQWGARPPGGGGAAAY